MCNATVFDLIKENKYLESKLSELKVKKFARFNNEECWLYEEGEDNHLDSLSCPVVISAETLNQLLNNLKEYEENIEYLLSKTKNAVRVKDFNDKEMYLESLCINYIALLDEAGRRK